MDTAANVSSTDITPPVATAEPSPYSVMPRKNSLPRQRKRRRPSVDANTALSIAQSSLARLSDYGLGVTAKRNSGESVKIILGGVTLCKNMHLVTAETSQCPECDTMIGE